MTSTTPSPLFKDPSLLMDIYTYQDQLQEIYIRLNVEVEGEAYLVV